MLWWDKLIDRLPARGLTPRFEADLKLRAQHLNHILQRERTRADRSGQPLTMLLVGYDGKSTRREDASIIVHVMQRRARITDEIGWFDQRTGFAVLPDTPVRGGRRFAQTVRDQLRERGVRTSFAIYQYAPPARGRDNDQDPGQGRPPAPAADHLGPPGTAATHPRSRRGDERPPRSAGPRARPLPGPGPAVVEKSHRRGGGRLGAAGGLAAAAGHRHSDQAGLPRPGHLQAAACGPGQPPFSIWKFRTMRADAEKLRDQLLSINEQDGPAFKIKADPRITRIGSLLRKPASTSCPSCSTSCVAR